MAARPSQRPSDAPVRRVADRYEVVERLARGGMGEVYRVRDALRGEERALKRVLLRDPRHRDVYRASFEREYRVLASLDHPRIVRVYEYGVDAEGPYYTMELVRGPDLREGVPRSFRAVCSLMREVASSLALLHARRLLYRDLNPGNVKVTDDDVHCKLLDFGALTDFGPQRWLVGAPPCIPPEALRGAPLDQRADLFALGSLAYWALTGRHAFPAHETGDLPRLWREPVRAPSELTLDVPPALDELVLSLLRIDPLARPGSAAEVIARLSTLGKLPPEDREERRRIALSFLTVPPFVGRARELGVLEHHLREGIAGRGSVVRVRAVSGAGRTRLVDELTLRAQLTGATALRVDARAHAQPGGTAQALALALIDLLPELAAACAARHDATLRALGEAVRARLPPPDARSETWTEPAGCDALWSWFADVSRERPLMIAVDDVEHCDAPSATLLEALVAHVADVAILLVLVERESAQEALMPQAPPGAGEVVRFGNLHADEVHALARSLLGETPHVERFAAWLYTRSAGSPLHGLELMRQLVVRDDVHYESGYWVLPVRRGEPEAVLPPAFEAELTARLNALRPEARALAEALALLRVPASHALCRQLVERSAPLVCSPACLDQETVAQLDELTRHSVLVNAQERDSYGFSSSALRDAAITSSEGFAQLVHHQRLGLALLAVSAPSELLLRLEAGWHLMHGDDELPGAQLVAATLETFRVVQVAHARYPIGAVIERALQVYLRHRRTDYERVPLLAAAAQAVMHDNYQLYARHADAVLDVLDRVTGTALARRLQKWAGVHLASLISLVVAGLAFRLVPKRQRPYSFLELLREIGNCVAIFTGAAALGLDAERAERLTDVLASFARMTAYSTPHGLALLCRGQSLLGRERQAEAYAIFDTLVTRAQDRRFYRMLNQGDRAMLLATARYGRAGISVFRADGGTAMEDAAALETCGLPTYEMIAPHLRYLYHVQRGELILAAPYQAQIEQQAIEGATPWHAELWIQAALLPANLAMGGLIDVIHIVHRLDELARIVPSLRFYQRLAKLALMLARDELSSATFAVALRVLDARPPRSFIGWTSLLAMAARHRNRLGQHAEARLLAERALVHITDADREYVALFLQADLQAAVADAGLGHTAEALARLDALLRRYEASGHPLALGLLHEARAQIAFAVGLHGDYERGLQAVDRIFRATGTPALIAKIDDLAALQRPADRSRARPSEQVRLVDTYTTLATEVSAPDTERTEVDPATQTDPADATRAEPHRAGPTRP